MTEAIAAADDGWDLEAAGQAMIAWSVRFDTPIVMVDAAGRLIWANPAAEGLIGRNDWFRRNGVRLSCVDKLQEEGLRELIAEPFDGVRIWICRGEASHVLVRAEWIHLSGRPVGVGLMLYPTVLADQKHHWGDFGQLFGLTPAEVEVAKRLTTGERAEDMLEALAVSLETVRTHIRRIYAKLGINSREQLFAVLGVFRVR